METLETLKAAIGLAPATTPADSDVAEPVAGEKGPGNAVEPYDAGNNPEACEAAERVREEEDRGTGVNGSTTATGASTEKKDDEAAAPAAAGGVTAAEENDKKNQTSNGEDKTDGNAADKKDTSASETKGLGAPKENPSAIPTAGGEKVGTQPVPGRETGANTAGTAPPASTEDGSKQTNGTAAENTDGAPPSDAPAANNVDGAADAQATKKENAAPNGAASSGTATPTKSATSEKPVSSAQKAMKDNNSSPGGSSLERKPSKMSRFVNRLKGRKSRGGDGGEEGEGEGKKK